MWNILQLRQQKWIISYEIGTETLTKMKSDFFTIFFVMIWIISISTQINAGFTPCPPGAPPESCKIYEVGRRSIQFRVCGGVLRSYFGYACGYRKRRKRNAISEADEIVLKEQRANRFLSTHHVTKRSFNVVEECCVEGCVWEEIFEYCKPTQFWITWKKNIG